MLYNLGHVCQCSLCLGHTANSTREIHRAMNFLFAQLDQQQKVLYIGLEAKKRGTGSEHALSLILGWSEEAIAAARRDLEMQITAGENNSSAQNSKKSYEQEIQANCYDAKLARARAYQHKIDRESRQPNYNKQENLPRQ